MSSALPQPRKRPRLLAPEVVQTSAMDCGPASLKCLLDGYGVPLSYGRLREACQTDVDGTSIDTIEEVAVQLGLDAEQVVLPPEDLLSPEGDNLPAMVVVRLPSGLTHFLVVWRSFGPWVQVMNPASGRHWVRRQRLLDELYLHEMAVPAAAWREWAGTEEALVPLRRRLRRVGLGSAARQARLDETLAAPGWRSLATLDAAARWVQFLVRHKGLRRGAEARRALAACCEAAAQGSGGVQVPPSFWSARRHHGAEQGSTSEPEEEHVVLRGAVALRVRGPAQPDGADTEGAGGATAAAAEREGGGAGDDGARDEDTPPSLSPDLLAAMREPPACPGRTLLGMLWADGLLAPAAILGAVGAAAAAAVFEAVLLRGLLELGQQLVLPEQRMVGLAALLALLVAMLLLELPIVSGVLRMGRRLELRLRQAFLRKIPRLSDRYFHSRLTSDMAERGHALPALREVPALGVGLVRAVASLALTTLGITWLDPRAGPLALLAALVSVVLPLATQPLLTERDLKLRTVGGALMRYYLDALLGLVPIRSHAAERSVRREHERMLSEWLRSALSLLRTSVGVQAALSLAGYSLAALLLWRHLSAGGELGRVMLLVYWALALPARGAAVASLARQYPSLRSVTLRLLEPLGAPEEAVVAAETLQVAEAGQVADGARAAEAAQVAEGARAAEAAQVAEVAAGAQPGGAAVAQPGGSVPAATQRPSGAAAGGAHGITLELRGVSVQAAGHTLLEDAHLSVAAGEHLAIVGPSGAGKSTLLSLLLGFHRAGAGSVWVDSERLDPERLARLRRETAWVDPGVQLFNRSLLDNVRYGAPHDPALPFGPMLEAADLRAVLEQLPEGMATELGEGGGLVSGGQGQRVRLGRALLRHRARLVLLDEPFRGLDRGQRRSLLAATRRWWQGTTLLCVTHDLSETLGFDRVVVVEDGRLLEQGRPLDLDRRPDSRYHALLAAERRLRAAQWGSTAWRRLRLDGGRLVPGEAPAPSEVSS